MSDSTASLRRKIVGAGDLQSVVRTMKAVAASSIGQYENSVRALDDYYRISGTGFGRVLPESGSAHFNILRYNQQLQVRFAWSCSVQTRDWWASLMM